MTMSSLGSYFECLVPSSLICLGGIRTCGLVGRSVPLWVGSEVLKAHVAPPFPPTPHVCESDTISQLLLQCHPQHAGHGLTL